jgi:prepilin-type N-terminal cleavage/methylation domain-containing protein
LRRLLQQQPALSLVELLVALTILALLSTAGLKMFQSTQTSFVDGRTSLVKAKRNEAIAAFIYNDFFVKAVPPKKRAKKNRAKDNVQKTVLCQANHCVTGRQGL